MPDTGPARESTSEGVEFDYSPIGRVVLVSSELPYVVLDFSIRAMPPPGQFLNVYRGDVKVGEIRITGPTRDTTIAGDLIAGEAAVGDEVRQD